MLTNIGATLLLFSLMMLIIGQFTAALGSGSLWYDNKFDIMSGIFFLSSIVSVLTGIGVFIVSFWV